jgi:hypothetical protein
MPKQFIYSLAASQLSAHVLKQTTHQKRPDYQKGTKGIHFQVDPRPVLLMRYHSYTGDLDSGKL